MARPDTRNALARFHEPVRTWFAAALGQPTRAQVLGWAPIEDGKSTLLLAPTGSGKTLAAFLVAIDRLLFAPSTPSAAATRPTPAPKRKRAPKPTGSVRVLYISPLKALAVDVDKNLRGPLAGIVERATQDGVPVKPPIVGVRTGDTPASDRARMLR